MSSRNDTTKPSNSNFAPESSKWIKNVGSQPAARLRLFCFAYAGGSAGIFRPWPQGLPPTIEVCPIQLPGRETRLTEPALTDFDRLITTLQPQLEPYLDLPFAFFGHSLGALVAFETARRLESVQSNFRRLFVSGSRAPQLVEEDNAYQLPKAEFVQKLREMGGTPEEILSHEELLDFILPTIRADFQLLATYQYQPGPPLAVPITVFGGLADPGISREDLQGWQAHTTQPIRLQLFPGHHFFIHTQQATVLNELARQLTEQ